MKKAFWGLLALLFLVLPVAADNTVRVESYLLASSWDLDGEGADVDQVIEAVAIIDNGSVTGEDYTIAAQPDTCRLLDLTIVDTDITAGSITVTGTDCWGDALVAAFAFTAGDDTGVQTLTVSSGSASGAYFKTVTEVETGTMTGESDETFALGYSTGPPAQYPMYGARRYSFTGPIGTNPGRYIDPAGTYGVDLEVTTSGSASTTLTSVDSEGSFTNVAVGDILILKQGDYYVERKVTARASANSVTLNASVNIAAAGVPFRYRKFWVFADPYDGWVQVNGWDAVAYLMDVDANADTGGVVSDVVCAALGPTYEPQEQVDTDTVASGSTGEAVTSIDLRLAPFYTHCRFGIAFGTNDDADAADEDINIAIGLRR